MKECVLCGGTNIEKFSEKHFMCKDCGLGTSGDPKSTKEYFEYLTKAVTLAKGLFPNLSAEELVDKVQGALHKIEKHPLDERGYCEYCQKQFDVEHKKVSEIGCSCGFRTNNYRGLNGHIGNKNRNRRTA